MRRMTTPLTPAAHPAPSTALAIDYDDVARAHERLAGIAHRTPVMRSATADALTGATLHFKCENLQRVGAFKIRGAYNGVAQFTPAQRAGGVVTFSSGNHGQAIARAAQWLGVRAVVVMPKDAPAMKVAATTGYGAEVLRYDRYAEDPAAIVDRLVVERGLSFIPPFDHPHVMAGQGTAAKELFEDAGELDMIVTPLGGGGLLSGTATVARQLAPGCEIVGVEPEAGNDGQQSLARGEIVRIATPVTIADAAQSRSLGRHTFPVLQRMGARVVTVSDAQLIETMAFCAARLKLVVEPTGCLAAAAVMNGALDVRGKRVGVVLSGGNIDLPRFAELMADTKPR
jgi:threo-3-hydroxy-L-aspartate ammonia-lyase